MSWREPVFEGVRKIVPAARSMPLDDSLSLLDDLGVSSRQLVELAAHIDRVAKRRVPTEEWFVNELSGERTRIGSLIQWLDTHHPRP
jgi:hypothetical protein